MTNEFHLMPLKQAPNQCGQTCLAMLSGKPVKEICKLVGSRTTTNTRTLRIGLKQLGVYADEMGWKKATKETVGNRVGILRVGWLKRNSDKKVAKCGHFVVVAWGNVYEPIDGIVYSYDNYMSSRRCLPTHFIEVLLP